MTDSPARRPNLRKIYEDHFDFVWNTLRRLGIPKRHLADVSHDTFIVIHRTLDRYDPERPVRPWLVAIAARVASDFRRRAIHRREVLRAESDSDIPGPSSGPEQHDARDIVLRALDMLSEEQRIVVVMHDINGFTAPEIADALSLPPNTVYSRLRLARKHLVNAVIALREGGTP